MNKKLDENKYGELYYVNGYFNIFLKKFFFYFSIGTVLFFFGIFINSIIKLIGEIILITAWLWLLVKIFKSQPTNQEKAIKIRKSLELIDSKINGEKI